MTVEKSDKSNGQSKNCSFFDRIVSIVYINEYLSFKGSVSYSEN